MWRIDKFTEYEDSDQSISEEEELGSGVAENCISLGGSTEKKGELHVLSQLEVLRDAREFDHATEPTISSQKRQAGSCIQDAFEFPIFNNEEDFTRLPRRLSTCNSDDEIVSDEESVENAGSSSSNAAVHKTNRSSKGGRGRAKSKFSFHFHPHKDLSLAVNSKDDTHLLPKVPSLQEDLEPTENREGPHSMSELLELFQEKKLEHSEIDSISIDVAVEHDNPKPSVAEFLDSVRENNVLLGGNSTTHSRTKAERSQLVIKRNICPLGDRNIDDDESSEAFDSGSSSGTEDDRKNVKHINLESRQKTMTDQFHEAFGISSIKDEGLLFPIPRQSGIGLFGKLQRVMQSEKEREMKFLRRLQTEASLTDEGRCIDVRILSRRLEAKLTVCCCSFIRDESSQCVDNSKMTKEMERNSTVIFSPRTCSDVELEPGKLIRIHPPWKEICIKGKHENIILSTYFSQIST